MKPKGTEDVALIKSGAVIGYLLSLLFLLSIAITASCGGSGYGGGGGGGYGAPQPMQGASFYVDAANGFDLLYYGTSSMPFKTITYALSVVGQNQTIIVGPGTYNIANGEMFPLMLRPGQILIGDEATKGAVTLIVGSGPMALTGGFDSATIMGAEGSRISGFQIGEDIFTALHVAIVASGVTMQISDNTFTNSNDGGIVFAGTGTSKVRGNVFASTTAIVVDAGTGNPDLGTVAEPGNNNFTVVKHNGTATVSAIGNTWRSTLPVCGTDIIVTSIIGGAVIWGSDPGQHCPP